VAPLVSLVPLAPLAHLAFLAPLAPLVCTAQHCTALHCTALHCTALHCTAPLPLLSRSSPTLLAPPAPLAPLVSPPLGVLNSLICPQVDA
jgi:hypothetical protein